MGAAKKLGFGTWVVGIVTEDQTSHFHDFARLHKNISGASGKAPISDDFLLFLRSLTLLFTRVVGEGTPGTSPPLGPLFFPSLALGTACLSPAMSTYTCPHTCSVDHRWHSYAVSYHFPFIHLFEGLLFQCVNIV